MIGRRGYAGGDETSERLSRTQQLLLFSIERIAIALIGKNGSYEIVPAGLIFYRRCPDFGLKICAVPYREPMVPFRMKSHIILKYPSG